MSRPIDDVLKIYYMILAVIGVPANLLAIVILSRRKCGLSTCTTRYLVAMALADFTVIMISAVLWYISFYYFPGTFLDIAPVCSLKTVLASATTDCSVWFTVAFSFDRFVAICCQKLKMKYCTGKTAALVLTVTCILLCLRNIPYYFTFEPLMIIDNVPWLCTVKPSYYSDPGWVGFDWFDRILTPFLPFTLILLINALTVQHILVTSRVRKGLRGQSNGKNPRDTEMESRRKSVILLFTISGSFIVLWSVYVIEFLYSKIKGTSPEDYTLSEFIFQQIGWMLLNLNCGINTFIYGLTQSKFREQIENTLRYPVTAIIQLMKKYSS
ncbi:probable G-protein coupled receptor 139 [Stegostoma tigrinum]|uniref:probable G-protein coupled receptor 139 n=1 Tax=Stegostoma tigrinum TaxID=3053191 RepID=UPI0028702F63|nr:probable G-protein coupled receptor 139 [Stegostoma tigrinum]